MWVVIAFTHTMLKAFEKNYKSYECEEAKAKAKELNQDPNIALVYFYKESK